LNASQTKKPLTEIIGGCAVIYTDTNTNKLYVYRNADRPLYRGMIENSMYMSSIEASLKTIGCDKITEFKQDTLYEIVEGKIVKTYGVQRAIEVKKETKNTVVSINRNSSNLILDEDGNLIYELTSFIHTNVETMVGNYVTPLLTYRKWEPNAQLSVNKYYEVLAASSIGNTYIEVKDETGKIVQVNKHAFAPHYLMFSVGSHCMLKCDIYRTQGDKRQVGEKGDVALIDRVHAKSQHVTVTNLVTGECFHCSYSLVKPLSTKEAHKIKSAELNQNHGEYPEHPMGDNFQLGPPSLKDIIKEEDIRDDMSNPDPDTPNDNILHVEDFGSVRQLADYTLENIINIADELKDHVFSDVAQEKIKEIEDYIQNYIAVSEKIKELEDAE
jgi:hypothetical protein